MFNNNRLRNSMKSSFKLIQILIPLDTRVHLKTSSGSIGIGKVENDEIRLEYSSGKIRAKDLSARLSVPKRVPEILIFIIVKAA